MADKIFSKDEWISALEGLKEDYKIFVPVKTDDSHQFQLMEGDRKPDFDFQNTRLSPKSLIFPQSDRMFEYSLDDEQEDAHILKESPKDFSPRAIVGIRPCDAYALQLVRINFDNPQYRDPWWVRRYESTVLVGLGCNDPCSTCFCTSVGTAPFGEKGLDVLLYDLDEKILARALTPKGEEFLSKTGQGAPADEETRRQADKLAEESAARITSTVPTDKLKDIKVTDMFEADFWDEVAFSCINCGTCTYVCPTCWCFDIQDEVYGREGDRMRNWDSCMYPLFTLEGSGHNPRPQKVQRVRQRFMHKFKYYIDKYGDGAACVGCGRCVQYCPVNIDIREVAEKMNNA